jgi:hypothetical protein
VTSFEVKAAGNNRTSHTILSFLTGVPPPSDLFQLPEPCDGSAKMLIASRCSRLILPYLVLVVPAKRARRHGASSIASWCHALL